MHAIEPHYNWRNLYVASEDSRSPFYQREYSEFEYTNRVYNFLLHPQWDYFTSNTLFIKIIFTDYVKGYCVIEMIGEWNDCIENDIMNLKMDVIETLIEEGIDKFILIGENVLNFHSSDDCYYEDWFDHLDNGWIVLINFHEHVLEEFFDEIPKESCPTIHLGSDEVKVENPEEFMSKMISICNRNDRDVVVWNPGIKIKQDVIRQTWQGKHQENKNYREIDSWNNYVNNSEPMTAIPKLLFKPIGYKSENKIIGGVLCMWPDVKLKKEDDFINQNPIYPSLLTYAWSTWTADIKEASQDYLTMIPKKGTKEFEYFAEFEEYLLEHKKRYFNDKPFQYFKQSDKVWLLSKPFPKNDLLAIEKNLIEENENLKNYTKAYGNTIIIKDRFKQGGYYPKAKTGETVFAITHMHSDKAKTVKILIGFETPLRANRVYTGIPNKGHWDANGGEIWLNGKALQSPKWKQAGWKPSKQSGWGTKADQEIPWTKEELYWTRKPAVVHLKKGKNTIMIKVPSSTDYQNWMFTFIPLSMDGLEFSIE